MPNSHQYEPRYLAWRLPEFRDFFLAHHVQLPLAKGDAAFFNPALVHGAGSNVSADVQRMADLPQVSAMLSMPTYAVRRLLGTSLTKVTVGIPRFGSRPTASTTRGSFSAP